MDGYSEPYVVAGDIGNAIADCVNQGETPPKEIIDFIEIAICAGDDEVVNMLFITIAETIADEVDDMSAARGVLGEGAKRMFDTVASRKLN